MGIPGLTFRVCTLDRVKLAEVGRSKHRSADEHSQAGRTKTNRRPHLAHISILIKNQLIAEDASETQLKNQKVQLMSQHHPPWLGCGGGVSIMSHRQPSRASGWKPRRRASFSGCTRAPAQPIVCCLLISCLRDQTSSAFLG